MAVQRPALLFSLEMGHLELTQRLLASEAEVNGQSLQTGRIRTQDWSKIGMAVTRLSSAPIFIDDNPNVTVMDIRARARRLKKSEGDLGIVVVDYLQLMTGRGRAENRQTEVAEISRGLKILARELEVPVVALSQLSRNLESRQDKTPQLSDLRESGSLEQDADVVLFIYRESEYNDEVPIDRADDALIEVAKHRNGPTGKANLLFLKQYARFENHRGSDRCCGRVRLERAVAAGSTKRSTALANPSSSLLAVTRRAAFFTCGSALPMAMLSPEWANIRMSLGMSPMVAISDSSRS